MTQTPEPLIVVQERGGGLTSDPGFPNSVKFLFNTGLGTDQFSEVRIVPTAAGVETELRKVGGTATVLFSSRMILRRAQEIAARCGPSAHVIVMSSTEPYGKYGEVTVIDKNRLLHRESIFDLLRRP